MSSPAKRPFTDETHASRASNATHASTPAELALQLQSVGSRVRKNVMEGYLTQRSAPPSPTKSQQPAASIFTSANDVLRDVYAFAPPQPPISPRKRARENDSDHAGDSMAVDTEAEKGEDTESDGETVIILDASTTRPVKPRPRRALMQTQSLPTDVFGPVQGPLSERKTVGPPEPDWIIQSNSSSQSPGFEPMVL
ncbi:hypothetical protein C8R43DRAFT_1117418 [Mycena crocata]|nr:hypothetical protein C8R43DRAFT_1117418 [Mycena crocata]